MTLCSAAGRRTAWSVAGHRSRGWRDATVPVQSTSEFQVSGATPGCGVPSEGALPGHHPPQTPPSPADHL